MRAIGKGSLATILAVLLHITRVTLWIVLIGLGLVGAFCLLVTLVPVLADWLRSVDGAVIETDVDTGDLAEFLDYFAAFITTGVMLYTVNRLLEILRTLRFGSPFVRENAVRLKRIGWALLIGEAAKFCIGFVTLVVASGADLDESHSDLRVEVWIIILAVFVLAEVFQEGARIKEEQDYTV